MLIILILAAICGAYIILTKKEVTPSRNKPINQVKSKQPVKHGMNIYDEIEVFISACDKAHQETGWASDNGKIFVHVSPVTENRTNLKIQYFDAGVGYRISKLCGLSDISVESDNCAAFVKDYNMPYALISSESVNNAVESGCSHIKQQMDVKPSGSEELWLIYDIL